MSRGRRAGRAGGDAGRGWGCARVPAGRGRWRSAPPRGPSSGHMLSSCRVRIATRGSKVPGTLEAAGILRTRIAASGGTLKIGNNTLEFESRPKMKLKSSNL